MSSDIKRRLRAVVCSPIHEEAAQAIEALEDKVKTLEGFTAAGAREIEALEGELKRYKELFDGSVKNFDPLQRAYIDRAVAAEARAERLRVALGAIRDGDCQPGPPGQVWKVSGRWARVARKALEDDKK